MSTRVGVQNVPDYPGVYMLQVESGDVYSRVALTQPEVEYLRASVTDAMAATAQLRQKRRRQA